MEADFKGDTTAANPAIARGVSVNDTDVNIEGPFVEIESLDEGVAVMEGVTVSVSHMDLTSKL